MTSGGGGPTDVSDPDYYRQVADAAEAIRARVSRVPTVGVVLGSGLGGFRESLTAAVSMRTDELPHWPFAGTAGHDSCVIRGRLRDREVIVLAGRSHQYEGHNPRAVAFPVRVLGLLDVKVVILTNAAGGIRPDLAPGALMIIDDHINLMGTSPLTGPNEERFGPRFPDMSQVYSARLRRLADRAARAAGIRLHHGVYAAVAGPTYETPAEIRYLRTVGADAVGMSTVPEAIVARQMGLEVLGISCISNRAAGGATAPVDHAQVLGSARRALGSLSPLLEEIVGQL